MNAMSITTIIKGSVAAVALSAAALVALPATPANAWEVSHNADSVCEQNEAVINWSFKNTEPNKAKYTMDVTVTNTETDDSNTYTVAPGETITGSVNTNKTQISAGKVTFKMVWTDGYWGVDTRKSHYPATPECFTEEPAFNANVVCTVVDKKAVFTLNVNQTAGSVNGVFTPADGTVVANGDPVEVTGVFDYGVTTVTQKQTTQTTADCTPEVPEIEVCRDGEVITIKEDERLATDTDAPCPEVVEIEVCRDGEIITINEDERLDTDTDAPCPVEEPKKINVCRDGEIITINEDEREATDTDTCVKGEVTELPKTGAGSLLAVLGSTFVGGTVVSQLRQRQRRNN